MVRPRRSSDAERDRNIHTGINIANLKRNKNKFYFTYRQIFLTIVMLVAFMGSGISYVWSNFEGTRIGYSLSRLQQKELRLKEFNRKLTLELATLKSPQSLEKAALELGLKEALPEQIVILP